MYRLELLEYLELKKNNLYIVEYIKFHKVD